MPENNAKGHVEVETDGRMGGWADGQIGEQLLTASWSDRSVGRGRVQRERGKGEPVED